jgi:pimeloyl-ACP methyl ester carboxylesterase
VSAETLRLDDTPDIPMSKGRDWSVDHGRQAKVSNAELRYAVLGEGEPVLLIHGTFIADSLLMPLRLYTPLFDQYRIVSYYRAGYNGSTLEKDSVSVEEHAEHAKELLDPTGVGEGVLAFLKRHPMA